jgi:hypothetical protein
MEVALKDVSNLTLFGVTLYGRKQSENVKLGNLKIFGYVLIYAAIPLK